MPKPAQLLILVLALICPTASAQTVIFSDDFESGSLAPASWRATPGAGGLVGVLSLIQSVEVAETGVYGVAMPLDVDALAKANGLKLTNRFVVRFQQFGDSNFTGSADGILIDDVAVTVPALTYATIPFQDGFESGRLRSAWSWSDPGATSPPGSLRPQGIAAVEPRLMRRSAGKSGSARSARESPSDRLRSGAVSRATLTPSCSRPCTKSRSVATPRSTASQNHLAGRPISVRQDSWRYRLGKLIARHKLAFATLLAAAAALLAFTATVGRDWASAKAWLFRELRRG